jgi:hypothetical protein
MVDVTLGGQTSARLITATVTSRRRREPAGRGAAVAVDRDEMGSARGPARATAKAYRWR